MVTGPLPVAGNVAVSGITGLGFKLFATYTYAHADGLPEGATRYQWYYATSSAGAERHAIIGATSPVYKVASPALGGRYVAMGVTPVAADGKIGLEALSPWQNIADNAVPVVSALVVSGYYFTGDMLTANATIVDPDGDVLDAPIYKWYYATDATGTNASPINAADKSTYKVAVETSKWVRVGVIPKAKTGTTSPGVETFSPWRQITNNAPPYYTSVAAGSCSDQVGCEALIVAEVYKDRENDPSVTDAQYIKYPKCQWYRCGDKFGNNKTAIPGATHTTYTFTSDDLGYYIQGGVTAEAIRGTLIGDEQLTPQYRGPIVASDGITYEVVGPNGNTYTGMKVNHSSTDDIAPVTKTIYYHTKLTGAFGGAKCVITQNLGADAQSTETKDATEAAIGWYWQFNRKQGYEILETTNGAASCRPHGFANGIQEKFDWKPENDPCTSLGAGWRIPNYDEWKKYNASENGPHGGYKKNDYIHLHYAGLAKLEDGTPKMHFSVTYGGGYWTSNKTTDEPPIQPIRNEFKADYFYLGETCWRIDEHPFIDYAFPRPKTDFLPVRCLRDL